MTGLVENGVRAQTSVKENDDPEAFPFQTTQTRLNRRVNTQVILNVKVNFGGNGDVKDVVGSQAGGAAIQFYCTLVSHGNVRPARGTFARIMQNTNKKKTERGCFEVGRMQTGISKEDEDLAQAIEASMVEQVPEQSRSLNSFMCPKCPKSGGPEVCPKCSPLHFCFLMEHGNSSDGAISKDTGHGNSEESPAHKSSCVKCSPEYFGCMEDPKAFRNPGNTKPGSSGSSVGKQSWTELSNYESKNSSRHRFMDFMK
ncbi:unnamed protein product [Bathycoccus prasinos]